MRGPLTLQGYPGIVLDAVATMGSSYGFPVVDAIGRSIALSDQQRYPALSRVVGGILNTIARLIAAVDADEATCRR